MQKCRGAHGSANAAVMTATGNRIVVKAGCQNPERQLQGEEMGQRKAVKIKRKEQS